jgi:alkylation response protein AidB-like acyl-CoA dehydrogenase
MFELTADGRALREEARAFAESKIRPRAIELDTEGCYPAEILDELGERRWTGLTLSAECGGLDGSLVELTVLI